MPLCTHHKRIRSSSIINMGGLYTARTVIASVIKIRSIESSSAGTGMKFIDLKRITLGNPGRSSRTLIGMFRPDQRRWHRNLTNAIIKSLQFCYTSICFVHLMQWIYVMLYITDCYTFLWQYNQQNKPLSWTYL